MMATLGFASAEHRGELHQKELLNVLHGLYRKEDMELLRRTTLMLLCLRHLTAEQKTSGYWDMLVKASAIEAGLSHDITRVLDKTRNDLGRISQRYNWLLDTIAWDKIKPGTMKRLITAIDNDCPYGRGVRDSFEQTLQWFSRVLVRHPFHVSSELADLAAGLALRLSSTYDRKTALQIESLLGFSTGDGAFLTGVLDRLNANIRHIYMQESDHQENIIARMNLLLHGSDKTEIITSYKHPLRDTWDLFNPNKPAGTTTMCDVVVAFPSSSETWTPTEYGRLDNRFKEHCVGGMPSSAFPELAFLLHGMYFLKPGGTMVFGGVSAMLNRDYNTEIGIRRKLVEHGNLEAVVLLPHAEFQHITGMPAALMLVEPKQKPHDILFVDARDTFDGTLDESTKNNILDVCKFHEEIPGFSKLVSPEELERSGYDLSPARYINEQALAQTVEKVEKSECYDGLSL